MRDERTKRIGIAKGEIVCPDELDEFNDEGADMFNTVISPIR